MNIGNKFRMSVALLLFMLVFSVLPAGAQGGDFNLTVLHTNDVHGRVDQFDGFGTPCDAEEAAANECFGGAARIKTIVDQVRLEDGNVVLLDGGDQFQGTLFYTQYKGAEAQEMMNALGYDAMAVGNHEFDDGPDTLGRFVDGANFPVLSANIDASAEPTLAGKIQPSAVIEIGGETIGVVGYTTEDTAILSSPGPNVVFNNIEASVQAAVDDLTAQGINKIMAVSHAGFMRNGGDDYAVFVGARNAYDFGPSLDEAVQQYIEAFGPVSPEIEGRVTQVGDSADQPPATLP